MMHCALLVIGISDTHHSSVSAATSVMLNYVKAEATVSAPFEMVWSLGAAHFLLPNSVAPGSSGPAQNYPQGEERLPR